MIKFNTVLVAQNCTNKYRIFKREKYQSASYIHKSIVFKDTKALMTLRVAAAIVF